MGRQSQERLDEQTTVLQDAQRARLTRALATAMRAHTHIRTQSKRLTQGKKLRHCKGVNAYDPTIAPMMQGKRTGPAQCGRKPGIVSDPATGFLFTNLTPKGHPSDPSYVLPFLSASLLARGAGQVRYKGLEGAVVHQGMTVMTHNGAVLVRIRRQLLTKRAQKFCRLLGLRPPKNNKINC